MPYSPEQIAAFVGAAAWLPQIGAWLYKAYRKPRITIIPDAHVELGFTTLGPIFNVRLAVSGDTHDVLLDSFSAEVKHDSGEKKMLYWQGTKETLNQIRDATGILQTVEKDETGIAIKVRPDALVDKLFRFQDPQFAAVTKPLIFELRNYLAYLRTRNGDAREALLNSDKLHALIEAYKSCFSWRPGKYVVEFQCKAIQSSISRAPAFFSFSLSPHDVEQLRSNFNVFTAYIDWHLFGAEASGISTEPSFMWVYPPLAR